MSSLPLFRRTAVGLVSLILIVLALPPASAAEARDPSELELKAERVIVFKDGYCLVLKRGTGVTDGAGAVYTDDVPDAAVLGSFWAIPAEGRLLGTDAGWVETVKTEAKDVPCLATIEVLKANLGKQCTVQLPDNSSLQGVIREVLAQETTAPVEVPSRIHRSALVSSALAPDEPSRTVTGLSGTHFILRTEQGDVLLNANEVRRLTIADMKATLPRTVSTTERTKRLTFRFAEPGQRRELLIAYFRPSVRWIPTYRIDLGGAEAKEKMAEVAMQAEILNEAEDLIDTPFDIVVGVPNFRFRSVPSPMVLEQTLRNALAQAAPQITGQFSNVLFTQRSGEFGRDQAGRQADAPEGGGIELPPELTSGAAQELFVYNLGTLTLRKGHRAAVPIFTARVPYRDVYTWDVQVKRADIATAPSGSGARSPLVLSENEVWRQLELVNTTNVPWTTGAVMIVQNRQPLAQELLTYTPPKDACRVPMTVAVDARGSFAEQETGRQLNALTWDGCRYAKIGQRAALSVRNHKTERIEIEITARLGGRAEKASDDGRITLSPYRADDWKDYRGSPAVNNSSTVFWKTEIKPGEEFQPTIDYHFFTRE